MRVILISLIVAAIAILVLVIVVYWRQNCVFRVEHFKKKKKSKNKKIAMDKDDPNFELDIDGIMDEVDKAREEAEEGGKDENDPDPEDNEDKEEGEEDDPDPPPEDDDFGNEGMGGPGYENVYAQPHTNNSRLDIGLVKFAPVKPPVTLQEIQKTKETVAAQPDYFIKDLLHFAFDEPFASKRMICVIPDQPKHFYVISLKGETNSSAAVVGPSSLNVIAPGLQPVFVHNMKLVEENANYDDAIVDVRYIIFYDKPVGHRFFTWLNNYTKTSFNFVNYLHMVDSKVSMLMKFPYFNISTVDVKQYVPSQTLREQYIHTIKVDTCVYSNKEFKQSFYGVYDRFHGNKKYQVYFELFFPYYTQILRNRLEIDGSTKLKEPFQEPVKIEINHPIPSLEVTTIIRKVFKEGIALVQHLSQELNVSKGDRILLTNQEHRSKDGEYYIVDIWHDKAHLQTRKLVKSANIEMINVTTVKIPSDDIQIELFPNDLVFIKAIDRAGVFTRAGDTHHYFSVLDDVLAAEHLYKCVTNPELVRKPACISEYDSDGMKKAAGADIWDRPCLYDEECPFFKKGQLSRYRGGCDLESGYCEMPVGYTNVGYRHYFRNDMSKEDSSSRTTIRFLGDIFEYPNTIETSE